MLRTEGGLRSIVLASKLPGLQGLTPNAQLDTTLIVRR